jgi:hypothetical protein
MAIRGGLAEFSVPELLQLLALQQKTGILTLTHRKGQSHVLFFWRGRVLAAADRRRSGRHQFLGYLGQNHALALDQVESVEDISRSTGQDIFTVLIASGVLGRDRLAEEMRSFTQLMIDGLVDWVDGSYEFTPTEEKVLPSQGLALHLNPEELVLESMRRADELTTMKESMLAPDLVLALVEDAPSEPLPREMGLVLRLIDGKKTIDAICHASPLGDYLTYEAISNLLSREKIMIVHPKEAPVRSGSARSRPRVSLSALGAILCLIVGSALLGAGLNPLLARGQQDAPWLGQEVAERRDAVRSALHIHVHGLLGPERP